MELSGGLKLYYPNSLLKNFKIVFPKNDDKYKKKNTPKLETAIRNEGKLKVVYLNYLPKCKFT